jgi:hypothetical protein
MSLPANFSGIPGEDAHHYFRNVCIELKKTIKSSKDINQLEQEHERFINACKQMDWRHKNSGIYHKAEGDKAVSKAKAEFERYVGSLKSGDPLANPQDLLDAILEVERLISSFKIA